MADKKVIGFAIIVLMVLLGTGLIKLPFSLFQGEDYISLLDLNNAFANLSCTDRTETNLIHGGQNEWPHYIIKTCKSNQVEFSYHDRTISMDSEGSLHTNQMPEQVYFDSYGKLHIRHSGSHWYPVLFKFNYDFSGKDGQFLTSPFGNSADAIDCSTSIGCANIKCGQNAQLLSDKDSLNNYRVQVNGYDVCSGVASPGDLKYQISVGGLRQGEATVDVASYRVPFETCRTLPDESFAVQDFRPGQTYDLYSTRLRVQRMCAQVPALIKRATGIEEEVNINKRLLAGERITVPANEIHRIQFIIKNPGATCTQEQVYSLDYNNCINPFQMITFADNAVINTTSATIETPIMSTGCPDGTARVEPNGTCVRVNPAQTDQPCATGTLINGSCKEPVKNCLSTETLDSNGNCVSKAVPIVIPINQISFANTPVSNQSSIISQVSTPVATGTPSTLTQPVATSSNQVSSMWIAIVAIGGILGYLYYKR